MLRWVLSTCILLYGLITLDLVGWKWTLLGLFLFSVPLMLQTIKSTVVNVWALWGGIFLVLQSLLSPVCLDPNFITHEPNFHEIDYVSGGVPGITGKQEITTDANGFRTTKKIDYKDDRPYRIVAIGGSTTEDLQLDDHQTWTYILQEELSKKKGLNVEVINTGVSGQRANDHLKTLQKIISFKPDLVLFMIGINDWNYFISDTFEIRRHPYLDIAADYKERLVLRRTLLGKAILLSFHSFRQAVQGPLVVEVHGKFNTKERNSLGRAVTCSFHPRNVELDYKVQLSKISSFCRKNNLRCVFITQVSGYRPGASEDFKKGFWMTPPDEAYTLDFESMVQIASLYNSYLIKFAKENNHDVCDAASQLEPSYNNFIDDCHFNTQGAHNMGMIVSRCVENYVK
jgi:lysophospholipase L1-like esterase